jgi:hypothetical protein
MHSRDPVARNDDVRLARPITPYRWSWQAGGPQPPAPAKPDAGAALNGRVPIIANNPGQLAQGNGQETSKKRARNEQGHHHDDQQEKNLHHRIDVGAGTAIVDGAR